MLNDTIRKLDHERVSERVSEWTHVENVDIKMGSEKITQWLRWEESNKYFSEIFNLNSGGDC